MELKKVMQYLQLVTLVCLSCHGLVAALTIPYLVSGSQEAKTETRETDIKQPTVQMLPEKSTQDTPSVNKQPSPAEIPKTGGPRRPHILMIVADDLGWNDVDWRDPGMHTPVLSRLASEGVVLTQSYVQPVCSPTRAALMSGYYPYHLGLQHESLRATQKAHLPDGITTLPQHLQKLGYRTHMAGKWHLGFCNWRYTPTYRGFHSFMGFYNAVQDYYTHTGHRHGYDFRHNKEVLYAANGTYSAYLFTDYIEQVIGQHDVSTSLFIYLPYQSVHGPLQVPHHYIDSYCSHIHNATRRVHCAMVAALDEGVGNVTRALEERGMLEDTLLLFTTDNGGPVHKGSNNWPLRGSKATLWEGGTRAMSFLRAPKLIKRNGTTYDGMIHAVDWLPTLVEAAGGSPPPPASSSATTGLDGVSQWQSLLNDKVPSARTEFVYNVDELKKNAALRQGRFKLLQGDPGHLSGWYPPPQLQHLQRRQHHMDSLAGADGTINMRVEEDINLLQLLLDRLVSTKTSQLSDFFRGSANTPNISEDLLRQLLRERFGSVQQEIDEEEKVVLPTVPQLAVTGQDGYQLFDLQADPNEHTDVKDQYPQVFKQMRARLDEYRKSLVPANFPPHDPASYPSNFNGTWSPGWC